MAAVLAAGPDAVLSHRSAAALWGLGDTSRAAIDVTSPRKCRRPRIDAHQTLLRPDEVTVERSIPVTNPVRTLLDLAGVVSEQQLEHALNEAEIHRLSSPLPLDALVARHPNAKGIPAIKRALEKYRQIGETVTRSHMERRFLALLDRNRLPRPSMNQPLGPYEPDAVWHEHRLIVELDSYAIHTTREAFERDRTRDRDLQAAGYCVLRITWRQLTTEADSIATQLRTLLGVPPPTPRTRPPRPAPRARRPPPVRPATRSAAP